MISDYIICFIFFWNHAADYKKREHFKDKVLKNHLKETSELKKNIILLFLQYIWPTKPFRKRQQMFHRNSLKLDWLGQVTKEKWFAS